MKRLIVAMIGVALILSLGTATALAQKIEDVVWNVQYYDNPFLSGVPVVDTTFTGKIDFDWGAGSPIAGVPADNFSIRFGQRVFFEPGTYRFTMKADDQARVSIDERAILNTLDGGQIDQELSVDVELAGFHQVQIDYREFTGNAFLRVNWQNVRDIGRPAEGAPALTVNVPVLNVRNLPTTIGSAVLTRVTLGQTFGIIGRNEANTWFQINANGVVGWVSAPLVSAINPLGAPVVAGVTATQPGTPTGFTAQTVVNLRLRSTPVIAGNNTLLTIPNGTTLPILGRNADTSWLQVSFEGQTGWVSARFVTVTPPLVLSQIPVTSQ